MLNNDIFTFFRPSIFDKRKRWYWMPWRSMNITNTYPGKIECVFRRWGRQKKWERRRWDDKHLDLPPQKSLISLVQLTSILWGNVKLHVDVGFGWIWIPTAIPASWVEISRVWDWIMLPVYWATWFLTWQWRVVYHYCPAYNGAKKLCWRNRISSQMLDRFFAYKWASLIVMER